MEGDYVFNLNYHNPNTVSSDNNINLSVSSSSSAAAIDSSNIGFKLLKKHGWKEGTGLGASEQGRLEPLEAYVKKNKRGLGADKVKKKKPNSSEHQSEKSEPAKEIKPFGNTKREKALSKRMKKIQEREKLMQEKEFRRAFFREFWPENV